MTLIIKLLLAGVILVFGWALTHRVIPFVFVRLGRLFGFRMRLTPLTLRRVHKFKSIRRGYYAFVVLTTLYVLSFGLELFVNNKPLAIHFEDRRAGTLSIAVEPIGSDEDEDAFAERNANLAKRVKQVLAATEGLELSHRDDDNDDGTTLHWRLRVSEYEALDTVLAAAKVALEQTASGTVRIAASLATKSQHPALVNWRNFVWPFGDPSIDIAQRKSYGLEGDAELDYREFAAWVADPELLESKAVELEEERAADETNYRTEMRKIATKRGIVYDETAPLAEVKLEQYAATRRKAAALRSLQREFEAGMASITPTLLPISPHEQLLSLEGSPPHPPFQSGALLGTDDGGKDVVAQILYGFRVSFSFALAVAFAGYLLGIMVGATMGFFGGWIDIGVQRFIEVWSSIPFLYVIMILAASTDMTFWKMTGLLIALTGWVGITYTVRGEFYREKSRDYVQAARAIGIGNFKVMFSHILPNSLVPVVTFLPFAIVAYISTLVSLDFLGYGLPPEIPSWGRLLNQGAENVRNHPHLIFAPVIALASTLFSVVLIGEAVREAFDPKKYARLR